MPYVGFVKSITTKPVVGVGRLTSPDLMLKLVKDGTLDLIGAARPSIADPYLPNKIKEHNTDQIKECIGCNICVSSDNFSVPIRCTQNPTMGEEWRRGWDPENIKSKVTDQKILVVGSGPSGLECTVQLARRGYQVTLAEAQNKLGGRTIKYTLRDPSLHLVVTSSGRHLGDALPTAVSARSRGADPGSASRRTLEAHTRGRPRLASGRSTAAAVSAARAGPSHIALAMAPTKPRRRVSSNVASAASKSWSAEEGEGSAAATSWRGRRCGRWRRGATSC